ncbi:MAG: MoaD/ThiS family protein [Planctomycetaceae bacterium]|nr:MoaD/ThiS family protein [Planctomycetaceae bacterium]
MPRVVFTPNLLRHLDCPPTRTEGNSVREALEAVFVQHHQLRGYIVDDQSHLRQHVNIFVDGQPVYDREHLSDAVGADSEIYVMQALSGG